MSDTTFDPRADSEYEESSSDTDRSAYSQNLETSQGHSNISKGSSFIEQFHYLLVYPNLFLMLIYAVAQFTPPLPQNLNGLVFMDPKSENMGQKLRDLGQNLRSDVKNSPLNHQRMFL